MAENQKMAEKAPEQGFRHIIRVANTDLKGEKSIVNALRKIKGVSFSVANSLCNVLSIDKREKAGNLPDSAVQKLDAALKNIQESGFPTWFFNRRKDSETGNDIHALGGDLDFKQGNDIKILQKIKSYRGSRHASRLPVRGQRTKSNFRKNKGNVTGVKRKPGKSGKI